MKKIKILFLIHDLGHGGAEKVLVNLVNNMDSNKFDIHVTALFGGGINEQFLKPHVHLHTVIPKPFPGNSHLMKLLSPKLLHQLCVKEHYDVEIAYLEGPSARIVAGCPNPTVKKIVWIHSTVKSGSQLSTGFRSVEEAKTCYSQFDQGVFVSQEVMDAFCSLCPMNLATVLYNTNETDKITALAAEAVEPHLFSNNSIKLVGVGKLVPLKGFDRLLRIHHRLRCEGYAIHTFLLGTGPMEDELRTFIEENELTDSVTLLGYQTNPYKYVSKCDLFICSSTSEGFSTAATEALIVNTPVCTVEVSGMREMLGENCEFGLITQNDEDSLYLGIKRLLDNPALFAHYKKQAGIRGQFFTTEQTVGAAQALFERI